MENLNQAKIEIISLLDFYLPTTLGPTESYNCDSNKNHIKLYKNPTDHTVDGRYNHFPLITDPDGSLWANGNRYLLSLLDGVLPLKHRTLESIASDLVYFRRWLLDENIDYLEISDRTRARPTYRFATFLHAQIKLGNLANSTCKRRIGSVQNFYRWLIKEGHCFKFKLWKESVISINYIDNKGFKRNKNINTTDLSVSFKKSSSNEVDSSKYINDGGKLRPLIKKEQHDLVQALKKIGNVEMKLAFYFALATGARLQTVFTLRRQNFLYEPTEGVTSVGIKTGDGTNVDTKYGKQILLLVPVHLYEMIRVYMNSERCNKRIKKNQKATEMSEQYLFLTRCGNPYYVSQQDPNISEYRNPPRGNGVTQFIRQQIYPELKKQGNNFTFRFHDLRATFGLNLVNDKFQKLTETNKEGNADLAQVMLYVKNRMGHENISTTQEYLNFSESNKIAYELQGDYETYLESLLL